MTSSPRPPLGVRAISDMNPLIHPLPNASKGEVGRGSHAVQAGNRVTSGQRLALGGVAPISPFLPLPPAPTAAELMSRCHKGMPLAGKADKRDTEEHKAMDGVQRRASSDDLSVDTPTTPSTPTSRPKQLAQPAAFMIRSYSMPVATQRDFEAQQRAARQQRSQRSQRSRLAFTPSWSMARTDSNESDTPSTPVTATGARSAMHRREEGELQSTPLQRAKSHYVHRFDAADVPGHDGMTWYKPTLHTSTSPIESGCTSCSDEAEVVTPLAVSPVTETTSFFADKLDAMTTADDFTIHPSHLQPPPMWTS